MENTGYNITGDYPFFVNVFIEAALRVPEYRTWAANQQTGRDIDKSTKNDWQNLCSDFEQTHAPTDPLYETRALQALTLQAQGSRSVTDYVESFKKRALVASKVAPTAKICTEDVLEHLFYLGLDGRLQAYWTAHVRQHRPEQELYRFSFRLAAELRLLVAQEASLAAARPAAPPPAAPRSALTPAKSVTYSPESSPRAPSPSDRASGGPATTPTERPRPTHHGWAPGVSTCLLCGSYTHLAADCPSPRDKAHSERMAKAWQEEQKAGTGRKHLVAHSHDALDRIRAARRPPGKGPRGGR